MYYTTNQVQNASEDFENCLVTPSMLTDFVNTGTSVEATKGGKEAYCFHAKELVGETVAHKALVQIAAIYKAEEALKNVSAEERKTRRQKEVAPLVEAYFAWVHEQEPATILSEKAKDGLKYSLNQEKYLKVFLEDGEVPIDNSAAERAIRPFTIGRANWHIIAAKANRLKIYEYLKHLLTEIPKHMGQHQPGLPGRPASLVGKPPGGMPEKI